MSIGRWPSKGQPECRWYTDTLARRIMACDIDASDAGLLRNDLAEDRADGRRVQSHELERERHQLVHRRRHSPQIEIFQDRGVVREEHVMHGKILALSWIDRRCVDAEQAKPSSQQCSDTGLRQGGPVLWECTAGNRSPGTKKKSLHKRQRLDLFEVFHFDLLAETRNVDQDSGSKKSVQGQLV